MSYRTYQVGHKLLPSVTTILEATQEDERSGNLALWYATQKNALILNEQACARGTALDLYFKQMMNRNSASDRILLLPEYCPYALKLNPWIATHRSRESIIDRLVYTDRYAGTLDLALKTEAGCYQVVELKSKTYKVHESALQDAKLQAVAYRRALAYCGHEVSNSVLVLVVTPYQLHEFLVTGSELELYERLWELRLQAFRGGRP
jgi:hypothetical protein